ncbi:MAG: hypothetical protein MPN21_14765 [Thermoanaerobaculia bacterium]|nr:hypothetical protein [Thermoanaerobaculia bacterium]
MNTRVQCLVYGVGLAIFAATAAAQNRAVDMAGAIDLQGSVVLPSKLAVLLLAMAMVLVSVIGALLAQRAEERREAAEQRRRLEERLAEQAKEIALLRGRAEDGSSPPSKSFPPNT